MGQEFDLNLVATNDVHYLDVNIPTRTTLICIGTQTHLSDPNRMSYAPEQFYLRSADEMAALFAEVRGRAHCRGRAMQRRSS